MFWEGLRLVKVMIENENLLRIVYVISKGLNEKIARKESWY